MAANKVGKRIKTTREERKLSQGELGKIAKINPHLISKYEIGLVTPAMRNLKKIATALQITTDYLIFEGEKKEEVEFTNPILKEQFLIVNKMDKKAQEIVSYFLDAFIKKKQVANMFKE